MFTGVLDAMLNPVLVLKLFASFTDSADTVRL